MDGCEAYYDMFPIESIDFPAGYRADDLEDLPKPGRWIATNRGEHAAVVVPGMPKQQSLTPVSLIDIYPTLNALCGIKAPDTHTLEGVDLTSVLSGKNSNRGKPVLTTYGCGNHRLRDDRYRYIYVVYRNSCLGRLIFDYASIKLSRKQPINLPRLGCTHLVRLCPGVRGFFIERARSWHLL